MAFHQLIFVYGFLPVMLLLYRLISPRIQKGYLLIVSLIFIAWGNPVDLLYLAAVILFNYLSGKQLLQLRARGKGKTACFVFVSSLAADLALLIYFKYIGFFGGMFGADDFFIGLAVPLGISFVTFSLISFLCDVYRGEEVPVRFLDFALYVTFFPKITSGPIAGYKAFLDMLKKREYKRSRHNLGVERFVVGLFKKTVIAGNLNLLYTALAGNTAHAAGEAWMLALSYTFMLYFDFSGYSDMALGIAALLGYELPENFDHPYVSVGVADFWRRWHITLGRFFRDYLYIPLGGNRKGRGRKIFNQFVVFLLTGLWHGANYTFLVWGLYHFVFITLDGLIPEKVRTKIPKTVFILLTFLEAMVGWVFFFSDSLSQAFTVLKNMIGIGTVEGATSYYLAAFGPLLLLAALLSLPLLHTVDRRMQRKYNWYEWVRVGALLALLFLSTAAMVSDTYTTFLYANF